METIKKFFEPVDMTEGTPWKKIVFFTVPMLVGNIAQQLYNTVDSVVVGNYVGDNALAAVGSAGPILNLLIVLFVGISVGAGIMVAVLRGKGERGTLHHHWELYHAHRDSDDFCDDCGISGGETSAGTSGYTGIHY